MSKPEFPAIIVGSRAHFPSIIVDETELFKTNLYGYINQAERDTLYDNHGEKWTFRIRARKFEDSPIYRNVVLSWLIANTYNPAAEGKPQWKSAGKYTLDTLKAEINLGVDEDDDIITQFEEGDIIKRKVEEAASLHDLIAVLNKYVYDVNEEELWREQGEEISGRSAEPVRFKWNYLFLCMVLSPLLGWLAFKINYGFISWLLGTIAVTLAIGIWVLIEEYVKAKREEIQRIEEKKRIN